MAPITSRNPSLPPPAELERLSQSLATLDVLLCRDAYNRYYHFDRRWDPEAGSRMAKMDNGSGDDYVILFTAAGAALKGFAHEAPMAEVGDPPRGMFDGFPETITGFRDEPAFRMDETTFCLWSLGGSWSSGLVEFLPDEPDPDPDGSQYLLEILDGDPTRYRDYAGWYFERQVPLEAIRRVYAHEPLTAELVASIAPECPLAEIGDDLDEIGYPRLE